MTPANRNVGVTGIEGVSAGRADWGWTVVGRSVACIWAGGGRRMRHRQDDPRRDRHGLLFLWLCLTLGAVWALPASALDVEPLIRQPDVRSTTPSPQPDVNVLPPAPAIPDHELDADLGYTIERVRFENFTPLPPGAGKQTSASTVRLLPAAARLPEGVENEVSALARSLANPESPLAKAIKAALAGPFTLRRLKDIEDAAAAAAREDGGWSLAQAFAPEQELTDGVLRIVVVPVWLEEVTVSGTRWSNPDTLKRP